MTKSKLDIRTLGIAIVLALSFGFFQGSSWRAGEDTKQSNKVQEAVHVALNGTTSTTSPKAPKK